MVRDVTLLRTLCRTGNLFLRWQTLSLSSRCSVSTTPRTAIYMTTFERPFEPIHARRSTALFTDPASLIHVRELRSTSAMTDEETSGNPHSVLKSQRENIFTIPNLLCLTRITLSPYMAHLIINTGNYGWALAVFGSAAITDALDGWIARNVPGQMSNLGSFLDPLSDKMLITSLYLSLTYVGLVPAPLTALVVSRDLFLVYAGLYIRYMAVEKPFTLKKYFDVSSGTAQVVPTQISKINTLIQLALVGSALCAPIFDYVDTPAFLALCGLTGTTTFASACSYAFSKDVYRFTNRAHDHQWNKRFAAFGAFIIFNIAFVILMPRTEAKPPAVRLRRRKKEE